MVDGVDVIEIPISNRQRRMGIIEFCYGRGLRLSAKKPRCYSWLEDGSKMMKGAEFIEALMVRLNVIATKERNNRGRAAQIRELICDVECPRIETRTHPATSQMRY